MSSHDEAAATPTSTESQKFNDTKQWNNLPSTNPAPPPPSKNLFKNCYNTTLLTSTSCRFSQWFILNTVFLILSSELKQNSFLPLEESHILLSSHCKPSEVNAAPGLKVPSGHSTQSELSGSSPEHITARNPCNKIIFKNFYNKISLKN